jgi:GTPase involved in cell partitioning and DNA repair
MYPEALDSLLKGLKRYDEYISDATEMGIRNDMDYVKTQILGELNEAYQMSEADAYQLIDAANQEEYSQMVIKKAGEAK